MSDITKEQLISYGKDYLIDLINARCKIEDIRKEFVREAIEALEQEPCDNAVSRKAVDTLVDELARAISDERCRISRGRSTATIMRDIYHLPPVTQRSGKWLITPMSHMPYCSACDYIFKDIPASIVEHFKYCPNCNARMFEPQGKCQVTAEFGSPSCDRNICISNEYNGIGCDECICNTPDNGCQKEDIEETIPVDNIPCITPEEMQKCKDTVKKYTPKNTELPGTVSRGVFEQVMWERNIAIEQLHELGYEFGQKIEQCADTISRERAIKDVCFMMLDCFDADEEQLDAIRTTINEIPPTTRDFSKSGQ